MYYSSNIYVHMMYIRAEDLELTCVHCIYCLRKLLKMYYVLIPNKVLYSE